MGQIGHVTTSATGDGWESKKPCAGIRHGRGKSGADSSAKSRRADDVISLLPRAALQVAHALSVSWVDGFADG